MTPPRLVSFVFGANERYEKMARVLRYSAAQHCPHWDRQIRTVTPPPIPGAHPQANLSHVANTQKMECWYQAVQAAADGDRVLLLDCDTMIVRPLDAIWDEPFDYAYTVKLAHRFPFNSGVVFLHVNPRTRAFITTWRNENCRMLREEMHHMEWRRKYGGINQASLGYALDSGLTKALAIRQLPCLEWNCEDTSWRHFDPAITRIVHLKSQLRLALFHNGKPPESSQPLITRWREYEQAALAATA